MLKSILTLSNVRVLNKTEQKLITGSSTLMCVIACGPGDGNVSIYDYVLTIGQDIPSTQVEVGCVCT